MTDPISILALGAAVGGATGKLVENVWDVGRQWIATYYRNHRDKAIETAEINAAMFLGDLAHRVKEVEIRLEATQPGSAKVTSALEDPDVAASLQSALLAAARTSSADKHDLLARAIADRLAVESESLRAVASGIAIEAVPRLTQAQLDLLGLAALLYSLRPAFVQQIPDNPAMGQQYTQWLISEMEEFRDVSVNSQDYWHLVSVNCLTYQSFMSRSLENIVTPPIAKEYWKPAAALDSAAGRKVTSIWNDGLKSIDLTPAGRLIGIYVHDKRTGVTTNIGW